MASGISIQGVLYGLSSLGDGSLQIQPGYGPYASLEEAFGTDGIGKTTQGIYSAPRPGLKFMIRSVDGNSNVIADEYIYLGGSLNSSTRAITNPKYLKITRELKSETPLAVASGSGKVYPVVIDSENNLAVLVPWIDSAATTSTAGLLSAEDKTKLDLVIQVVEAGGWNVDSNFQVSNPASSGGGASSAEVTTLRAEVDRIKAILYGLYDQVGTNDGQILVENN